MKKTFYLVSILAILVSCGEGQEGSKDGEGTARKDGFSNKAETRQDSLFHEVMEGHDVGMAKMGQLTGYRKKVKSALDSLKAERKRDKHQINLLESISADLNQADYSMNRWMEEFKLDSAEKNVPVRVAYLESERDKIGKIRERILKALNRVDSLYSK